MGWLLRGTLPIVPIVGARESVANCDGSPAVISTAYPRRAAKERYRVHTHGSGAGPSRRQARAAIRQPNSNALRQSLGNTRSRRAAFAAGSMVSMTTFE